MDPFIEFHVWEEFHNGFVYDIADALVPAIRPKYVVRRERRVYVESDPDDPDRYVIPDATVLMRRRETLPDEDHGGLATAVAPVAAEVTLPMPVTHREAFLTVRETETMEVVTVIELLSPANKRPRSDGRSEYLHKRDAVLESTANLVEIDLLRKGERLPTVEPLPPADYFALVCRARRRPRAEVYAWTLQDALPTIPIPLKGKDPDVSLNLQSVFVGTFDRTGYDYSLKYEITPDCGFTESESTWITETLKRRGSES
jgi:hypothetical protein